MYYLNMAYAIQTKEGEHLGFIYTADNNCVIRSLPGTKELDAYHDAGEFTFEEKEDGSIVIYQDDKDVASINGDVLKTAHEEYKVVKLPENE